MLVGDLGMKVKGIVVGGNGKGNFGKFWLLIFRGEEIERKREKTFV